MKSRYSSGDRLTTIFAHAISTETDCLVCSTYFRRALAEAGEDPERFALDAWEETVVEFGWQIARDAPRRLGRIVRAA